MVTAQKILDVCRAIIAMGEVCVDNINLPEAKEAFAKISLELLSKLVCEGNVIMIGELTLEEVKKLKEGKPQLREPDNYPVSDTKIHVVRDVRFRLNIDLKTAKELVEKYIRKICNGEI